MTAVRGLANRNSSFMRNEVELCKLANLTSIAKLELDQKEKAISDAKSDKDAESEIKVDKISKPMQDEVK